ncbi:MAG: hypothetical protein WBQ18_20410 [Solirubrobacteraceae bacterium]
MSGAALILWIAAVHLLGLGCVALLMFPALKENQVTDRRSDSDGDDGWGRGPTPPPTPPAKPSGGLPLPDAVPARVRLREHGRLADQLPGRERRPTREPARRPTRTPHTSRSELGRTRRSRYAG